MHVLHEVVGDIVAGRAVEFSLVRELQGLFGREEGRRRFTQLLERGVRSTAASTPSAPLSLDDDAFELLLYLINTTLMEMDAAPTPDIITARVLMHASTVIRRTSSDEFVQEFIKDHHVWEKMAFWEELVWDELAKKHREREGEGGGEVLHTVDPALTVWVVEHTAGKMLVWGVPQGHLKHFAVNMLDQAHVPSEASMTLLSRMSEDSFWDEARLRSVHGTLRERGRKEGRRQRLRARVHEHFAKRRERKERERMGAKKSSSRSLLPSATAGIPRSRSHSKPPPASDPPAPSPPPSDPDPSAAR
eukprot:TRINITY_DN3531_c0_g1_i1.p1 TRINITY_DN3531_c0_g1~~TRINITY_DN3531_c0_g1_i1.p1  ORF type:complete len:304 (+),score=130.05 TRINITY_DN3531_c0_g1_i1:3-914(+)